MIILRNGGTWEPLQIHFILQLHRGGSKLDAHNQMEQTVLELLLQSGADVLQVNAFVRELYYRAGQTPTHHADSRLTREIGTDPSPVKIFECRADCIRES